MDDVFDDTVDDNFLMQRESQREHEKFSTMGMKEGILEKKFNQDEDVVAEYFIQGFNKTIAAQRLVGRIALIEYIAHKILPQDKSETAHIVKSLNEIIVKIGKEENAKVEAEIDNLMKEVKKFQVEP